MTGWRVPTPHEVLAGMFVVATAAREAETVAPGSALGRILSLFIAICGVAGIAAASRHLSPRVRGILEEHDTRNGNGNAKTETKKDGA